MKIVIDYEASWRNSFLALMNFKWVTQREG